VKSGSLFDELFDLARRVGIGDLEKAFFKKRISHPADFNGYNEQIEVIVLGARKKDGGMALSS
jgi:hypothetical protein